MSKIYIVGIGPGAYDMMTIQAVKALKNSDIIVGYHVYTDLVKEYFPEKEFLTTPMRQEAERCKMALEQANQGKTVSMICSGDAGIYGMAGLMYEVAEEEGFQIEDFQVDAADTEKCLSVKPQAEKAYRYHTDASGQEKDKKVIMEVIPGVTAANSGAAVLGAPLIHDFAVISLSDLLTPWEKIEKRLSCAAEADFEIVLYNPSSHKRADYLQRACDILLQHISGDTICGYVENIGREGTESHTCTLRELRETKVNMFTTVFIGNSTTRIMQGKMVTPRGYQLKNSIE